MRDVPEWTGKTDSAHIPPRVRDRVFQRADKQCHICTLPIAPGEKWQCDHKIALIEGGAHAEANLAPAHVKCHAEKTAGEVKRKSKVAAIRQRHTGVKQPAGKLQGRGFSPTKPAKAPRPAMPFKRLYAERSAR